MTKRVLCGLVLAGAVLAMAGHAHGATPGGGPEGDKQAAEALAGEARKAYEEIKADVIAGKLAALRDRILDNGNPVKAAKWESQKEELEKDLLREKPILSDPRVAKAEADAVQIEKGANAGEVIVRWGLKGTAAAGKEFLPQRSPKSVTQAEDGALIVYMKRIDGKWYWQPFGW